MVSTQIAESARHDDIYEVAATVADPEMPFLTIADLGVLRDARLRGDVAEVTITPTYSGCPAMETIRSDIARALQRAGYPDVDIHTAYSPAWTTDWLSEEAKRKLADAKIAPPGAAAGGRTRLPLLSAAAPACPHCHSEHVEELSRFGSTACTSVWRCLACSEPFSHMKAH